MQSNNKFPELKRLFEYGFFLNIVSLVIDFSLRHKKMDVFSSVKNLYQNFENNLSEQESKDFAHELDNLIETKINDLKKEADTALTKEEASELMKQLLST